MKKREKSILYILLEKIKESLKVDEKYCTTLARLDLMSLADASGELECSITFLALRWKWSNGKVKNWLKIWEDHGIITNLSSYSVFTNVEGQMIRKGKRDGTRLITIVDFYKYNYSHE